MSIEQDTIMSLIGTVIVFGIPIVSISTFMRIQNEKQRKKHVEEMDANYLATYGQEAYEKMLKQRQSNKADSDLLRNLKNTPLSGVWSSNIRHDVLIQHIESNLPSAPIGNRPHRLSEMTREGDNEITITGEWTYPKIPGITTFVELELKFAAHGNAGATCHYKYTVTPSDCPFAAQIIELTNTWLKQNIEAATYSS